MQAAPDDLWVKSVAADPGWDQHVTVAGPAPPRRPPPPAHAGPGRPSPEGQPAWAAGATVQVGGAPATADAPGQRGADRPGGGGGGGGGERKAGMGKGREKGKGRAGAEAGPKAADAAQRRSEARPRAEDRPARRGGGKVFAGGVFVDGVQRRRRAEEGNEPLRRDRAVGLEDVEMPELPARILT
jgi:hypothetical protein